MSLRRITMNHVGADAYIGPRAGRGGAPTAFIAVPTDIGGGGKPPPYEGCGYFG